MPSKVAMWSPVTEVACLKGMVWTYSVHFSETDNVVTLFLCYQKLTGERNVNASEELFHAGQPVQEQQPDADRQRHLFG
jgi:hypothetical protein